MLIHALYQNITSLIEALNYNVYTGYYNNDLNWFDTATLMSNGYTPNLTTVATTSGNTFGNNANRSLKLDGFFRARKTGLYRFFTRTKDASYLVIDGDTIIDNGGLHAPQNIFGSKSLIVGNYYPFSLYYGLPNIEYPPAIMGANTTTITGQLYGNGNYYTTASSTSSGNPWHAFDNNSSIWRSNGVYPTGARASTTTTAGNVLGEWLQIQLPFEIILEKFLITPNSTGIPRPRQVKLLGSNNTANPWNILYETDILSFSTINVNSTQSYNIFRLVVLTSSGASTTEVREMKLFELPEPLLSAGFKEPLDDGTNPVSTDVIDYITNGTSLGVYYNTNPATSSGTFARNTYTYINPSLYGKFKVSILSIYLNRTNFTTNKNDLIYLYSPDLFNAFSGNTLIVIDEEPVDGQEDNSFCKSFCDGIEFECDLHGKIDLIPTRNLQTTTENEGFQFQKILIVLDVEKIEQIHI